MTGKKLCGATQDDDVRATFPEPLHPGSDVADGGDQDSEDPLFLEQLHVACLPIGILAAVAGQDRELPLGCGVLSASYDAAVERVTAVGNDDSDGGAGARAQLLRRGVTDIAELAD